MFFPIPMQVETEARQPTVPTANLVLIALNVLFYFLVPLESMMTGPGMPLMTILTYGFAHGSFFHLLFNMWYLWVVGNPVNRRIGNFYYAATYLGTIVLIGILARCLGGSFIYGSSGAVFAVLATATLLLPVKRVEVHYLALFPLTILIGLLRLPRYGLQWFIRWDHASMPVLLFSLLFLVLELLGFLIWFLQGQIHVTSLGHLTGFVCGVTAVLLLPERITIPQKAAMS
ncbi:Rhomboid protease GlpG [Gimesia panareensis]|uniref:Rhomboid protease GlpG n=1 Tax=Gimesia panareensis TaxID=2527978 RepID=A0A517Q7N3_9PLAN|nr:rhomboid family intramembrane serine protease [Gimesia panareensis]QDT27608.1 Rhomboid protease GlpG [Gimesia panareensis]